MQVKQKLSSRDAAPALRPFDEEAFTEHINIFQKTCNNNNKTDKSSTIELRQKTSDDKG